MSRRNFSSFNTPENIEAENYFMRLAGRPKHKDFHDPLPAFYKDIPKDKIIIVSAPARSASNKITVVHCKESEYDIYIGRPSILGNPYTHISERHTRADKLVTTREEAIQKFFEYAQDRMHDDAEFRDAVLECENKILGCWCKSKANPKACHGDVFQTLMENWRQHRLW